MTPVAYFEALTDVAVGCHKATSEEEKITCLNRAVELATIISGRDYIERFRGLIKRGHEDQEMLESSRQLFSRSLDDIEAVANLVSSLNDYGKLVVEHPRVADSYRDLSIRILADCGGAGLSALMAVRFHYWDDEFVTKDEN